MTLAAHDLRYRMADEFTETVKGLWDSWESGARIADPETGVYVDPARIHPLDHEGEFYSVRGPLNHSRSPQGRPVIVQAGSSESGQAFASRHAELLFSVQQELDAARSFRGGILSRARAQGRDARHMKVLPGLLPVLGGTEEEARDKLATLGRFVDDSAAMHLMSDRLGYDMSRYSLDEPVPDLPRSEHIHGYVDVHIARAREAGQTLRDLYNLFAAARGHAVFCGTPEQTADMMEEWFRGGACDGFVLLPAYFPAGLDEFVDEVVPILQRARAVSHRVRRNHPAIAARPAGAREPLPRGTRWRDRVGETAASFRPRCAREGRYRRVSAPPISTRIGTAFGRRRACLPQRGRQRHAAHAPPSPTPALQSIGTPSTTCRWMAAVQSAISCS